MLYKLSLIAWKWHYPVCTAVWRIEIWTNFKYSLYSHKSTQNCNVSLGFPETHPRSGSPREGQNLALQCDLWPGARSPWRQLSNTVTHSEEERKPSCYSWAINYKEITIEKSYERHLHSRILYSRSKYHKIALYGADGKFLALCWTTQPTVGSRRRMIKVTPENAARVTACWHRNIDIFSPALLLLTIFFFSWSFW